MSFLCVLFSDYHSQTTVSWGMTGVSYAFSLFHFCLCALFNHGFKEARFIYAFETNKGNVCPLNENVCLFRDKEKGQLKTQVQCCYVL